MAQKKKTSGRAGTRKRSSSGAKKGVSAAARGKAAAEERARIRLEIAAIVLIAVGAFLIFALFAEASGKLGAALDKGLSGIFGPMAGALPFFLIAYGVLLIVGLVRGASVRPVVLTLAIFILFCIMLAGRYIEVADGEAAIAGNPGISGVFSLSAAGDGGGVLGAYIAKGLVSLIGKPGLYILCIALTAISVILLANMPISKAAGVVREKSLSRRDERQKRIEERRALLAEEYEDGDLRDAAADGIARARDGGTGLFRMPSFLGGGSAGAPEGASEANKQQNILDAVKNDETYGDHSKGRGLEIEDTTLPFRPDERPQPPPDASVLPTSPATRRPAQSSTVAPSEAALGKKPAGTMHYGSERDDSDYKLPPVELLLRGRNKAKTESPADLKANAARLEQALRDFRVEARVAKVTVGPTVTRYEVEPDVGVKIQSIRSLEPDLALKLEVKSVRVVPMPGQSVVGIEAYNSNTSIVSLRDMIDSDEFREAPGSICFALGKNISGKRIVVDLKEMPHLLIAGTTGSGKSVCINSILLSILYRAKPSEVKLILVDPKVVELKSYNDLPHLLLPVVTDPERAAMALSYAVTIMNDRYKKFAENNVRNLEGFNEKMRKEGQREEVLPQIVIVIDELSDLMMVASAKVQESISRLAAMARAAGMHLIVATQQPLASILTSVIKANIPSRVAFAVSSNSASRVILDNPGAERLHGKGDMLFSPVGTREPMRVQGAFVEENEVVKVVNYVKKQMDPDYSTEVMSQVDAAVAGSMTDDEDDLFMDAVEMVAQAKQASVSMIQRRFRVGYNRAARLVDMMEERGIVAASDGTNKPRRLIMGEAQLAGFLAARGQGDGAGYAGDGGGYEDDCGAPDNFDGERPVTFDDLADLDDFDSQNGMGVRDGRDEA
ncbi:MAG: DNA translocase FtsK [Clostridiales Family XIII bacterium]|nr:DNA translocase FtsK [Clostridiales Family XIII bacterium]